MRMAREDVRDTDMARCAGSGMLIAFGMLSNRMERRELCCPILVSAASCPSVFDHNDLTVPLHLGISTLISRFLPNKP